MLRPALALALAATTTAAAATPAAGDPAVRRAAQRGLVFLATTAQGWQKEHNGCFGCHVQGVSIEGLSMGLHHQYEVPQKPFAALVENVINGPTGIRSAEGLSSGTFPKTSRAFAGAALARYDAWVSGRLSDDLLRVCRELLPVQRTDGSVVGDHPVMGPVAAGTMQTTFQAMQAWRQCYARSADDAWRAPLRRAEVFVTSTVKGWGLGGQRALAGKPVQPVALEDLNHALMALLAAGVGSSEPVTAGLVKELLARQGQDGGWAFGHTAHPMTDNFMSYPEDVDHSNPLATGQTVSALRAAGLSDADAPVARGIRWLLTHQRHDGGWGSSGAAKAEAMWAVLGLVSVDVLTVSIRGVQDGDKVAKGARVIVEAKDNQGGAVAKVALLVDDAPVQEVKGPELSFELPELSAGRHVIDAVATNAKGQVSRRRLDVFSGDVYLTELGARFDETHQVTQLTARNLARADEKGSIELEVFTLGKKDSEPKAERRVTQQTSPSTPGPLTLAWAGKTADGKPLPRGRYLARLSFRDEKGAVRQQETQVFFHDTAAVARAKTGEVQGQLSLSDGIGFAANAQVELVNGDGEVVQRTQSNEQGNFRFKAVPKGTYTVRARKQGKADLESAPVAAEPAAKPAAANMGW